jgi:hypothetical protein
MSSALETWFGGVSSKLPPNMRIFYLSQGLIITTALSLAAELGVADLLADGPRSSDELARDTSAATSAIMRKSTE